MKTSKINKKQLFIDQHGNSNGDKWCVEYIDGSYEDFKHVYGGAMDLADMVEWDKVAIDIDGDLMIGEI